MEVALDLCTLRHCYNLEYLWLYSFAVFLIASLINFRLFRFTMIHLPETLKMALMMTVIKLDVTASLLLVTHLCFDFALYCFANNAVFMFFTNLSSSCSIQFNFTVCWNLVSSRFYRDVYGKRVEVASLLFMAVVCRHCLHGTLHGICSKQR